MAQLVEMFDHAFEKHLLEQMEYFGLQESETWQTAFKNYALSRQ